MPVINTNTASNTALRYLNLNSSQESSALSKLASGSRIVKASDDAAGLGIATSLKGDTVVLSSQAMNASQTTATLQTADGGLSSISDILTRMKALATESSSDNVTDKQRTEDIQTEFNQLNKEITQIADGTTYGGQSLLNGSYSQSVKIGTGSNDTVSFTLKDATSAGLKIDQVDVSSQDSAKDAVKGLDEAIDQVTNMRADIGSKLSEFNYSSQDIATNVQNLSAAQATVMDADVSSQKSSLSSADVLSQAAIAALSQASKMPQELLSLLQQ